MKDKKAIAKVIFNVGIRVMASVAGFLDQVDLVEIEPQEALKELDSLCPDKQGTCLIPEQENKQEYDLDIIVPCYQVGNYIKQCAESILKQKTGYSFRAIFIDDGSKDGTGAYLDTLAEDNRVVIIHQENQGLSRARNRGLAMLNSRYVMFVDSDDYLEEGAVEALLQAAEATGETVVCGDYNNVDENNNLLEAIALPQGLVKGKEMVPGFAWGKVYNSCLYKGIGFPLDYWFEDTLFRKILCNIQENCYSIGKVVYNYRKNNIGISKAAKRNWRSIECFYVYRQLHKDSKIIKLPFRQSDYEELLRHIRLTLWRTKWLGIRVQKLLFVAWRDFLQQEAAGFATEIEEMKPFEKSLRQGRFWTYFFQGIKID